MGSASQRADLDDLMLAMDVVDTLRHQQSLVEHALSAEQRDAALTERIRDIYRQQGIAVSDDVIAAGVKALREERFAYREPPGGIKTWLAKCYVQRAKAYKPIAGLLAVLGIWWGANFAFSTLPEQRELERAMEAFNNEVASLQNDNVSLNTRLEQVADAAENPQAVETSFKEINESLRVETALAVEDANGIKRGLAELIPSTYQDADDFRTEQTSAAAQLTSYEGSVEQLRLKVTTGEHNIRLMRAFATMPVTLNEMVRSAKKIAAEPAVAAIANASAENAIAALKSRDIESAERAQQQLAELIEEVSVNYKILIVSEPGEKTGVWRYPESNNNARNYYLVVEAVDDSGRRLERSVVSEEDGKTYRVRRWAMRVDERTYNRVGRDKADDGIVQDKVFGEKARGFINPNYRMNTTGASIVSW